MDNGGMSESDIQQLNIQQRMQLEDELRKAKSERDKFRAYLNRMAMGYHTKGPDEVIKILMEAYRS